MTWVTNPYRFGVPLVPAGVADRWEIFILGNRRDEASVAQIEMAATPGGANQCTGGTAYATNLSTLSYAANAFDGNAATHCRMDRCYGTRLGYQFASPVAVREIRVTARNDSFFYQTPAAFVLRRSVDGGATWQGVGIFTYAETPWTSGETKTWAVGDYLLPDDREQARMWRLNITARQSGTNGTLRCGELEMARSAAGADICGPYTAPLAIRGDNSNSNERLFNGTAAQYWHTYSGFTTPPWYLGAVFDVPEPNIYEIRVASNPSGDPYTDSPGAFTIEWSSNGVDWHVTDTVAAAGFTANSQFKTFTVTP